MNACGGDLTGNWKATIECATVAQSSPLLSSDPSLPDSCKSAVASAVDTAHYDAIDVTASFSGTELHETGSFSVTVRFDFNAACMKDLGATTVDTAACNQAAGGSMQSGQDGTTCTVMNGGCSCTLTQTVPIDVTGAYRIEGNQLVTDNGMVSSDYCVSGNTAELVENGLGLNGLLRLTRIGDAGP